MAVWGRVIGEAADQKGRMTRGQRPAPFSSYGLTDLSAVFAPRITNMKNMTIGMTINTVHQGYPNPNLNERSSNTTKVIIDEMSNPMAAAALRT
jgi:hypothetical protein